VAAQWHTVSGLVSISQWVSVDCIWTSHWST